MPSHARHRPYFVYLDGKLVDHLIPIVLEVSNNAGRLDHARFVYNLATYQEHVENTATPEGFEQEVEIWALTDITNPLFPPFPRAGGWKMGDPPPNKADLTPLFRGSITQQNITVGAGENVEIIAQREAIDFGEPLEGYRMIPQGDAENVFHDHIVFNPELDGKIVGNMSSETWSAAELTEVHYFSDPETPTGKSQEESGETSSDWTVQEAVKYLCAALNPDEETVKNPPQADFNDGSLWSGTPALKNVLIERGTLLPDALDQLLSPLGYSWHVVYYRDEGTDALVEEIAPYKLFAGTEKTFKMAAFGSGNFDFDTTNTRRVTQRVNLGKVANRVRLHGSLIRRECTFELYPAWPDADDFTEPDLLTISDPFGESTYWGRPNVWRLWLANEDGSISGLRFVNPKIDETLDLSSVFPDGYVRRARRAMPMLTRDRNNQVRPPFVEYEDPDEGWLPLPSDVHPSILKKKIGVYFAGDTIPMALWHVFDASSGGNPPKLRITCTIEGDRRLVVTSPPDPDDPADVETTSTVEAGENGESIYSPKGKRSTLFLDMSDTFHDRKVVSQGPHRVQTENAGGGVGDHRNDWQAAQDFTDRVLRVVDMCNSQTDATLPGLNLDYILSDQITKVEGREIDFNLYSPGRSEYSLENKYPFVNVIRWKFQENVTEIHLAGEATYGV